MHFLTLATTALLPLMALAVPAADPDSALNPGFNILDRRQACTVEVDLAPDKHGSHPLHHSLAS
jgi:hypothetical protein